MLKKHGPKLLLLAIAAVFLCGNLGFPLFLDFLEQDVLTGIPGRLEALIYFGALVAGGLVAQVCLIAMWVSLGIQPIIWRVPISLGLVVLVATTYIVGLRLPDGGFPLELAAIIALAAVLLYFGLQVPLWGIRNGWGLRISSRCSNPLPPVYRQVQFDIRYLLLCTAGFAIALAMLRWSLRGGTWGNIQSNDLFMLLGLIAVFILHSALLTFPCMWLMLHDSDTGCGMVAWLLSALSIGSLITSSLFCAVARAQLASEVVASVFCFGMGLTATILTVLLIVRKMGYRLVTESGSEPPA